MALNNQANIKAVITADDRASSVLKGFGDHVQGVGHKVAAGLELAAKGLAIGTAAAAAFGVTAVKAFSESEDVLAQTNAVLKSTASAAGVTADQVTQLASALQKSTKYSDEQVQSAENLLLTFTSIGKDIFPDATKVVLDMSTALGQDLKSSSIQVGKALQDPILGVTALRRVGVNFSKAQQDVIANLVETNHKAEAQKLILQELQTEFGGSAEAAGKTFSGSLVRLRNQLDDVQETIGKTIVQRLQPFAQAAANAVASINWETVINRTVDRLAVFYRWLSDVGDKIAGIAAQVGNYLLPKFEALWNTITTKLAPAIGGLIAALGPTAGVGLVAILGLTVDALNLFLQVITPVLNFLKDNTWIVWGFVGALVAIKTALMIEKAVAAFLIQLAVLRGVMIQTGGVAGGLRAALLGIIGPWQILLTIAGVAAVVAGIKEVAEWLDKLLDKWDKAKNQDIPINNNIKVKGGSDLGLAQRFRNAIMGRAIGGPVNENEPYIVGEKGPELFVPSRSGRIIPNNETPGMNPNQSVGTININISAGAFMGNEVDARKYANLIMQQLRNIASSKNTTVADMLGA